MIASDKLIWAAGFIDGEGSICITPTSHGSTRLSLQVAQKIQKPLTVLQDLFGGSICLSSRGYFIWTIASNKALSALTALEPFLIVKGSQARLAIQYQLSKKNNGIKGLSLFDRELHINLMQQLQGMHQ